MDCFCTILHIWSQWQVTKSSLYCKFHFLFSWIFFFDQQLKLELSQGRWVDFTHFKWGLGSNRLNGLCMLIYPLLPLYSKLIATHVINKKVRFIWWRSFSPFQRSQMLHYKMTKRELENFFATDDLSQGNYCIVTRQ